MNSYYFFKITYSLFSIVLYIHVTLYQNFFANLILSTHCCTDFYFIGFSEEGDVKQTVSLNIRKWFQCPLAEKTTNLYLVWLSKGTQCRRKLLCNSYSCNKDDINTLQKCCDVCKKESNGVGESCPATHSACMERQIYYPVYNRTYCIRFGTCSFKRQFNGCKVFYIYFKHFAFVGTDEWPTVVVIEDTSIMAKSDNRISPHDILAAMSIWLYKFSETKCIILNVCRHWDVWLSWK